MKKNLFIVSLIFITTSIFIGCTNDSKETDSNSNSSLLIGKWKVVKYSNPDNYEPCDYEGTINFLSANKLEDFDACSKSTATGTWTLVDNSLTVTESTFPIPIVFTIKSITKDTLIVTAPDFGGGVEEITYTKL